MMRAVPDEVQARPNVLELAEVNPAELEVVKANLAEVNPAEVVEANLAVAKLARQTSKKSSTASLLGAVGLGGAAPPSSPFSFRRRSVAKPPPRVDHRRGSLRDQLDLLLVKAALERQRKRHARKARHFTPLLKFYAAEAAVDIARDALQIHGGYGYTREFDIERHLRDVKLCEIGEGTSEIQRMIIARHLLRQS